MLRNSIEIVGGDIIPIIAEYRSFSGCLAVELGAMLRLAMLITILGFSTGKKFYATAGKITVAYLFFLVAFVISWRLSSGQIDGHLHS
jgi:hypothetical protein